MPTHNKKQQETTTINTKPQIVIADVPVTISFLHHSELLQEYSEVIPVEFDPKTHEGSRMRVACTGCATKG